MHKELFWKAQKFLSFLLIYNDMKKVFWQTLTNWNDSNTLKQHGFKAYFSEKHQDIRNISLCGNVSRSNEDNERALFTDVENEGSEVVDNNNNVCKTCLKIYNSFSNKS